MATQTPEAALAAARAIKEKSIPKLFQVVVECQDENDQKRVYEQMHNEGRRCRVLTLA